MIEFAVRMRRHAIGTSLRLTLFWVLPEHLHDSIHEITDFQPLNPEFTCL